MFIVIMTIININFVILLDGYRLEAYHVH